MLASSLIMKITGGTVAMLAGAVMGGVASLPALAQTSGQVATTSHSAAVVTVPHGRQWAGFAYDAARGEFVLFGGDDSMNVFGDTWIRKHGIWTKQHPAHSPSPRTGAAMVYDAATRQLLLFGGSTGGESGFRGDTWLWTGTT
jgi:hypothetical protein